MTREAIATQLHAADLHEESVERVIDHYEGIQQALRKEQYGEVGRHTGNFCENLSNILRVEAGGEVDPHPNIGNFVNKMTSGGFEHSLSHELRVMVPNAMRTAYDIRNRRDTVHLNLETTVSHADAALSERLCSWMLAELVREFGTDADVDAIHEILEELAAPVETGGPLARLNVDLDERNQQQLADALEGIAEFNESGEELIWTDRFEDLSTGDKLLVALLRQQASVYNDRIPRDEIGVSAGQLAETLDIQKSTVYNHTADEVIVSDENRGGYLIPVEDINRAISKLQLEDE